jgi:hypothetical protein
LTALEQVVLRALVELGEAPAAAVARRAGLSDDAVLSATLERIVRLGYAVIVQEADPAIYRGVAQAARP